MDVARQALSNIGRVVSMIQPARPGAALSITVLSEGIARRRSRASMSVPCSTRPDEKSLTIGKSGYVP